MTVCVRIAFDFEELVVENHFISVVSQSETLASVDPCSRFLVPPPYRSVVKYGRLGDSSSA